MNLRVWTCLDFSPQLIHLDKHNTKQTERGGFTWGVPQAELDPLSVDFETGCVVFKHCGDVTLQGNKNKELIRKEAWEEMWFFPKSLIKTIN